MNTKKIDKFTKIRKKIVNDLEKIQANLLNLNTFIDFDIEEFKENKKPYKIANKLSKKISKWKKSVPEVRSFFNIETACHTIFLDYKNLSTFYKKLNKSKYLTDNESKQLAQLTIGLYNSYNTLSCEVSKYLATRNVELITDDIKTKTEVLKTMVSSYDQLVEQSKTLAKSNQNKDAFAQESYNKQMQYLTERIKESENLIKEQKTEIAKLSFKKQVLSAIENQIPAKAIIKDFTQEPKQALDKKEIKTVSKEQTKQEVKEQPKEQIKKTTTTQKEVSTKNKLEKDGISLQTLITEQEDEIQK